MVLEVTQSQFVCGLVTTALGVASFLGVALPYSTVDTARKLSSGHEFLSQVSAGVVLAVSWLHLLADSQETLGELAEFPVANASMLAGFIFCAFSQSLMACHHACTALPPAVAAGVKDALEVQLLPSTENGNGSSVDDASRFKMMEASISFHSVLIGLSFGFVHSSWQTQVVFGAALVFHQFLEGCALGMVGQYAGISQRHWVLTFLVFTLSLPTGVVTSVLVQCLYHNFEENVAYCWATGMLNGFAAGTLAHVGVEMITRELEVEKKRLESPEDIPCMSPSRKSCAKRPSLLQMKPVGSMFGISLGAVIMTVLALWA